MLMRYAIIAILSIFLIFLIVQVVSYTTKRAEVLKKYNEVKSSYTSSTAESSALQSNYEYYQNPANLEKELRARFNFKKQGENMIIIVPQASSSQ